MPKPFECFGASNRHRLAPLTSFIQSSGPACCAAAVALSSVTGSPSAAAAPIRRPRKPRRCVVWLMGDLLGRKAAFWQKTGRRGTPSSQAFPCQKTDCHSASRKRISFARAGSGRASPAPKRLAWRTGATRLVTPVVPAKEGPPVDIRQKRVYSCRMSTAADLLVWSIVVARGADRHEQPVPSGRP